MIQAVADKIIVEVMRASKTSGGLILPDNAKEPQGYGRVISAGEIVLKETEVDKGAILVFHPMAGMDIVMDKRLLKVLKFEELYGILKNEEVAGTLDPVTVGAQSPIVKG
jgi:co-chaperonin GroES (HSP10)